MDSKTTNEMLLSRAKGAEKPNPAITPEIVLNKTEDFNNIVVMSGTAKRKPLEKKENRYVRTAEKSDFKIGFSKLRVPFCKPHQKQTPTEERFMTKSCEVLFECIKPYKDIRVGRKSQAKESIRTFGSVLTTDVIWERKAMRKVQFFSFSEENSFLTNKSSEIFTSDTDPEIEDWGLKELIPAAPNQTVKTVSSDDFITNAFPEPGSI